MTAGPCPLCQALTGMDGRVIERGPRHAVLLDAYPSAVGHTLVIPARHAGRLSDLDDLERRDVLDATTRHAALLGEHCDALTIGINDGPAAGQTVPHLHVHLIPRHDGDVPDPRGGVRWVLPDTAAYWQPPA